MYVHRKECRIINGENPKPNIEKPPVIIPVNLPKRKYSVDQGRLYIERRIIKHKVVHGTYWIWMRTNSRRPYGEIRVAMRDGGGIRAWLGGTYSGGGLDLLGI